MHLQFKIKPQCKTRPRFNRRGYAYTCPRTRKYESDIGYMAKKQLEGLKPFPKGVALTLQATFQFKEPKKRLKDFPRGDTDNFLKALCDALNLIAYFDDDQITQIVGIKQYGETDLIEVAIVPVAEYY